MDKFLIDAGSDRRWERWVTISLERRYTSVFLKHFLSSRVEVGSGNTGFDTFFDSRQHTGVDTASLTHDLQLSRIFKMDLTCPTHKFTSSMHPSILHLPAQWIAFRRLQSICHGHDNGIATAKTGPYRPESGVSQSLPYRHHADKALSHQNRICQSLLVDWFWH